MQELRGKPAEPVLLAYPPERAPGAGFIPVATLYILEAYRRGTPRAPTLHPLYAQAACTPHPWDLPEDLVSEHPTWEALGVPLARDISDK